ncbi:G-protein coupled receptor GRL101-like protein, partial [Dinothrombium tinctorium]
VIKGNRLKNIEAFGFYGMSSLKSLDLSNQMLENISQNAFLGLRSLLTLDLSHNNLYKLEDGVFNGLHSLRSLDLSNNFLSIISPRVFNGLTSLQVLATDEFKFCCLVNPSIQCSPEPDEFSSCEDLMSNIVLRFCIWVLGVIALIGNVLVLIWRVKLRATNRVHSFLISNLALGDLLMGVYLMIIACVDFYYRGVYIIYDNNWKKSNLCKLAGFLSTLSSESSVFTLTVITLDRFITIIFPFRINRMKLSQTVAIMLFIWFLCICIAGIPLLNIDYFDNFYGRSGVCLALHITHHRPNGWEYSVFVYLVLNLTSLALIAVAYIWMFLFAHSSRRAARSVDVGKTDSTMARRIMIIVFTDFFCWMPIIILGLCSLHGIKIPSQVYAWVAVFILPLNAALNPVIYTLSTPLFLGGAKRNMFNFHASFLHSETQRSSLGSYSCQNNEAKNRFQRAFILDTSPPHNKRNSKRFKDRNKTKFNENELTSESNSKNSRLEESHRLSARFGRTKLSSKQESPKLIVTADPCTSRAKNSQHPDSNLELKIRSRESKIYKQCNYDQVERKDDNSKITHV